MSITGSTTSFRISTLLGLIILLVFLAASIMAVLLVNNAMRRQALEEARGKARILLDRNLATHLYFSHQLKPRLFQLTEGILDKNTFDPVWMSSTYAVRGMTKYFDELHKEPYYYKECAVNARSPENEADPYEQAFLKQVSQNTELAEQADIRSFDGQPFLTVLRRGETLEDSCMRCHSAPDQAPAELVKHYGGTRSFQRQPGEVVSAISIRIPLASAYAAANQFTRQLSLLLLTVLVLVCLGFYAANRSLLLKPLNRIRDKALKIAQGEAHLGDIIAEPRGRELTELVQAFNLMSLNIKEGRLTLENSVQERTSDLEESLNRLQDEVQRRVQTEAEYKQLIQDLKETINHIKTLRGLLPICASCKKIRDDEGYWTRLESYITEHSEAQFTHGLCPGCLTKLYGLSSQTKHPPEDKK